MQDSIALCPPLIINAEQVDEVLKRFRLTLDDTYTWSRENFA